MKNGLSARQLAVTSFTALLSLGVAVAGIDWLGALLAVPVVVGAAWVWSRLGRRDGGWLGSWNGIVSKGYGVVCMVWMMVLGAAVLGSAGARMTAPTGKGREWVCILVWLCVLWMARGKPGAFCRGAEIFYLVMSVSLVLVLLFGATQIHGRWLLAGGNDLMGSFLTAAGVGCSGVAAFLLWDGGSEGEQQRWQVWSGVTSVAVVLISVVTIGTLSPALAVMQERPFFVMTVGLGESARMEGFVSSIWLLADVTLMGLVTQSGRRLWCKIGLPWERGAPWVLSLVVLAGGLALEWMEVAGELLRGILPMSGLILGGIAPLVAWIWEKWRKKVE